MMWWRRLQSWRDEKFILDQLKAALKEEYYNFDQLLRSFERGEVGLKDVVDKEKDINVLNLRIQIRHTAKRIRQAAIHGVPIPSKPQNGTGNKYWDYAVVDQESFYVLTPIGHRRIKREIMNDWDLWSRPIIAWTALVISVISLIFTLTKG